MKFHAGFFDPPKKPIAWYLVSPVVRVYGFQYTVAAGFFAPDGVYSIMVNPELMYIDCREVSDVFWVQYDGFFIFFTEKLGEDAVIVRV